MAGFERPDEPSRPAPVYPAGPSDFEYLDEPLPDVAGGEPPRGRDRPPRERGRRYNLLWRWRRGLFIVGLLAMAMVAAAVSVVARVELPPLSELELSSYICAAGVPDGQCGKANALAKLSAEGDRDYVRLEELPPVVINAVIATEDRDFFDHKGIDPVGIGRALYRDLRGGGLSQGGSTITQQYVKNRMLSNERTVTRKIKEAVLAMKLEKQLSKEEILEGYFNTVYFGRNAYGIAAASQAYFNVDVRNLDLAQAAYLAGLIRAPKHADATTSPDEAKRRRRTVLDSMLDEGYISQADRDVVDARDWAYVLPPVPYQLTTTFQYKEYGTEYVTDYVQQVAKRTLVNELGHDPEKVDQELAAGGLRIYTTLDLNMQALAYDAVYRSVLTSPGTDPAASLVAIDDQGMVRAMVAGRDIHEQNDYAHNNFAVMGPDGRQVGSTFKPIALAAALKDFVSPTKTRLPAPSEAQFPEFPGCNAWLAHNYSSENTDTGTLDLFQATAASSNTAYAELMYQLTPQKVMNMAAQLGFNPDHLSGCLPDVLGSGGSSPLEMAEVFSTFANRGVHKEPTIITRIDQVDQSGETTTLWQWQPEETPVLTPEQADVVNYALQGVIDHGTGTRADIGRPAAGKTGTTSKNKDAWFIGYVPKLTAAVWMGYPEANWTDPECDPNQTNPEEDDFCRVELPPMRNLYGHSTITGGSLPALIWKTFMESVTASWEDEEFVEPTQQQLQAGRQLGQDFGYDDDTTTSTEPDYEPDPSSSTSSSSSSTSSTTHVTTEPPTSDPDPSIPWPTSTTRPRGGGGGGTP